MNAPPEFDPDYPQTNGGGVALDAANPKHIAITYAMRDPDTASGSPANQYKIWPSFEYSLNNGNSWQTIDAGYLEDGDLESAERRQTLRIRWKQSSAEAEFTARLTDLSNQEEVNLRAAALRQFCWIAKILI